MLLAVGTMLCASPCLRRGTTGSGLPRTPAQDEAGRGAPLHPGAACTAETITLKAGERRASAAAGSRAAHVAGACGAPRNASAQTGFARGAIVCRTAPSVCNAQQSGLI